MPAPPNIPQNGVEEEVVLINKMPTVRKDESRLNEIRNNKWVVDSGASSHMTDDTCRRINTRKIQSEVKIGSGDYILVFSEEEKWKRNSDHFDQYNICITAILQTHQSYNYIK